MANLSVITSCVKYLMFIFNFFFVITGIIVIAVGATVQSEYNSYTAVLDEPYRSIPAFLIAIGVLIFLISFFGCCGAFKENYCMILTFAVLMIGIFIFEVAAGISGFVLRDRTSVIITQEMKSDIKLYKKENRAITIFWDNLQQEFSCCGVDNAKDWKDNDDMKDGIVLPVSCCEKEYGVVGELICNTTISTLFEKGCKPQLADFISSHAGSVGATGVCIAVIQFIGILFACHLAKRTKYETGS